MTVAWTKQADNCNYSDKNKQMNKNLSIERFTSKYVGWMEKQQKAYVVNEM